MFYLYFVLPPVIIVISVAFTIFIISRKSFEIEKEILMTGSRKETDSKLSMAFKSRWLHLLEKIAHSFKVFSLKTYNRMEAQLSFIRNKKNKIDLDKKELEDKVNNGDDKARKISVANNSPVKKETVVEKVELNNSMDVVRGGDKINRFRSIFRRSSIEKVTAQAEDDSMEEDRIMISKEAVYPEEKKEELENILVERIAADPRDIEAYERLGDYYVSQGNKEDAKSCYKQVLKLNPKSLSVRNKLNRFSR